MGKKAEELKIIENFIFDDSVQDTLEKINSSVMNFKGTSNNQLSRTLF